MSVQAVAYHQSLYMGVNALGAKSVVSDATLVIDEFPEMALLCKQFPHPLNGVGGEIEVPGPLGSAHWQQQQAKVNYQGAASFMETERGDVGGFLNATLSTGGKFNAWFYEGTPDRYSRRCRIVDAFFVPEAPDRDWESRAQILMITGTIFYHYFGQVEPGNVQTLSTI